jgi:predicted NUDIX family NTP pyrophosphohydrolase
MEWPKGSGVLRSFPEVDRAAYFVPLEAKKRINAGQVPLIERLLVALGAAVPW